MIRVGTKYQHLVHGTGCGCFSPVLQQASRRLEEFSRRSFLACAGAAAATGIMPGPSFAQGPASKVLLSKIRLFDGKSNLCGPGFRS
ncbi:hypothetical protein ABIA16_000882 [Sinorhizobium fredii]|nr:MULTISPECIES: twin-arginine translocation signal domain-containing protein [Sinorhizobium]